MVLLWMITVVSPRWMLLDVVVIVRVTLQPVRAAMLAKMAVAITTRFIALTVLSVVLICAHMPQILEERLVAGFLLRSEVRYVGGDIRQVPASFLHRTADSRKSVTKYNLIAGYRRGTRQ